MADPNGIGNAAAGIGTAAAGGFMNPFADIGALVGGGELIGGLLGLNKAPAYTPPAIDPKVTAMVDRSLQMAKEGYSPEQIAAFKDNVAQSDAARFQHGIDAAGGGLGKALAAGNSINDSNAFNQLAAKDAALKLANQHYADQSVKYLQSLEDKTWMQNNIYRKGLESAFGGAAKQGLSTLTGSLAALASGYKPSTPNAFSQTPQSTFKLANTDSSELQTFNGTASTSPQTLQPDANFEGIYPQTSNAFQQAGTSTGLLGTY